MLQAIRIRETWRGSCALGLAIGLHVGVIAALLSGDTPPPVPITPVTWVSLASITRPIAVETPPPQPVAETQPVVATPVPQPTPVAAVETPQATVARPKPKPKAQPKPKPKVVRAPSTAPPTATPLAETPVTPRSAPAATAVPEPAPVIPAHYNAAYLNNPAPSYPARSRRLGEQGKVLLRARVIPNGTPETVEVQESSGSSRLDAAAREAVAHWRFIPARQGEIILASWVLVPINFKLEH